MYKKLLTTLFLGSFITTNAQTIIFQENWDGSGPGISEWTLLNEDGNTPFADGLSSLITNAWNILSLEDFQAALGNPEFEYPASTEISGNVAVSNSWYDPEGAANDWLITPAITLPAAGGLSLSWEASSLGEPDWLEDYEVSVSTTTNAIDSFTQILDVEDETNTGINHVISLDPYAGQTVYIAFRNKSENQYTMMIDNIVVTSSETAGIYEYLDSQTIIYPNPANDFININSESVQFESVTIIDINGRIIKEIYLKNTTEAKIDISHLSSGLYIISISSEMGIIHKRFSKGINSY